MSYQKDRDEFIGVIVAELSDLNPKGACDVRDAQTPVELARLILRNAATIQRCEERVCSDEWADRDRVPCPAVKSGKDDDCCCDYEQSGDDHRKTHRDTPRVQVEIMRARQRIERACQPWGIKPNFSGDPRGCCVKLILPSGRYNSWGGAEDGFCVPVR